MQVVCKKNGRIVGVIRKIEQKKAPKKFQTLENLIKLYCKKWFDHFKTDSYGFDTIVEFCEVNEIRFEVFPTIKGKAIVTYRKNGAIAFQVRKDR